MGISFSEFKSLANSCSVIPVSETVVYDAQTPLTAFYQFKDDDAFVFLEGVSSHERHNRYSYLALDPHLSVTVSQDGYAIVEDGVKSSHAGGVYDAIESVLGRFSYPESMPDFYGGLLGNLSYECVTHLESVPVADKRALGTPLAAFIMPRVVLIFDRLYHTMTIVRSVFLPEQSLTEDVLRDLYDVALEDIVRIKRRCESSTPVEPVFLLNTIDNYDTLHAKINCSKNAFLGNVNRCKRYIEDGDIFQVQISRRAQVAFEKDPFLLYRYLRNFNPSPLLVYMKLQDYSLISSSPEILVNVQDGRMDIRPIAGTRKRYSSDKDEAAIIQELLDDPKERAEHVMLVDLARNDVGRACELDSVSVNELMIIEKYAHVIHMVSDVSGQLKEKYSAVDALKFGFPAGTVTGAPKIRAMEIIAECEQDQREFYSGGVVFFDFKNNLKTALAIRSILVKDKVASTQAAAGIVADSISEMEFKESENKMRSCLSAMAQFGENS